MEVTHTEAVSKHPVKYLEKQPQKEIKKNERIFPIATGGKLSSTELSYLSLALSASHVSTLL